jgi:hypothetical protein
MLLAAARLCFKSQLMLFDSDKVMGVLEALAA